MTNFQSRSSQKRITKRKSADIEIYQKEQLEQYRAFMTGYVKRINESTFNVPIGGIRIGLAKYTRLAQINLNNRVITFSRYAIENVPERGRRYLVLHELAHVKEASHNKRFWQLVAKYEPDYRQIGKNLEKAFNENVKGKNRQSKGLFSLDNLEPLDLSSEPDTEYQLITNDIDLSYGDELLNVFSEEKEKQELDCAIYDDEPGHFLDWICP